LTTAKATDHSVTLLTSLEALSKRRFLERHEKGDWTLNLYHGPSLTEEDTLEFTLIAKAVGSPEVTPCSDITEPVVIRTEQYTLITWSSRLKEDLLQTAELTFGEIE